MSASVLAILAAAIPIVGQIFELGKLLLTAQTKPLTLEEVQLEIEKILARSASSDAEENAAAGITKP